MPSESPGSDASPARAPRPPDPAASLILMRDAPGGLEVLMVKRRHDLAFGPGKWVFPGGRVEAADGWANSRAAGTGRLDRFRLAAIREMWEETGVNVAGCVRPIGGGEREGRCRFRTNKAIYLPRLVPMAYFVTPPGMTRRFATWIFAAGWRPGLDRTAPPPPVAFQEISALAWRRPSDVLQNAGGKEPRLFPPTTICLQVLSQYRSVSRAVRAIKAAPVIGLARGSARAQWQGKRFCSGRR